MLKKKLKKKLKLETFHSILKINFTKIILNIKKRYTFFIIKN